MIKYNIIQLNIISCNTILDNTIYKRILNNLTQYNIIVHNTIQLIELNNTILNNTIQHACLAYSTNIRTYTNFIDIDCFSQQISSASAMNLNKWFIFERLQYKLNSHLIYPFLFWYENFLHFFHRIHVDI